MRIYYLNQNGENLYISKSFIKLKYFYGNFGKVPDTNVPELIYVYGCKLSER